MRYAIRILAILLLTAASFLVFAGVQPGTEADPAEFYFTRLAYTQNNYGFDGFGGGRNGGTMPKPMDQFTCPELGGGDFFPRQGWGWAIDYPGADCKLMWAIHRLTNLRVHANPNVISALDEDLFKFPFLYAVSPGGMFLDEPEAARIREYLLRGGFLHVDDFWGLRQLGNFQAQMRKVFPDRPLVRLTLDHEIFKTFFNVDTVLQIPNRSNGCYGGQTWEQADDINPAIFGISDDSGRLMMVVTYNSDLGDAWEYMDLKCYPAEYSGYAYRAALNFMIYAMTH